MTQEIFPHARIAMGNGDLVYVTNVKYDLTDNSKLVHTLRKKGAGFTQGTEDTNLTFDAVIGENGEEADWVQLVKKPRPEQIRVKIPGRTITIDGKYSSLSLDMPLDSEIKVSLTFIGHTVDDS
jgi:hypothetical protein